MSPMSPRLLRPRASGGFDPRTISGLAVWLDAQATTTLNGGTAPSDGTKISQWNDRTANARNASQGTSANQPTYSAAGLNGRPAVQFSAANSTRLNIPAAAGTFPTGITLFVVCQKTGSAGSFEAFPVNRTAGLLAHPMDSYNNTLLIGGGTGNPTLTVNDIRNVTTPSVMLRIARASPPAGPLGLCQLNFAPALTGITGTPYGDLATEIQLGTRDDGFTKFTGLVGEVLIYAAAGLTTSQQQQIEGYLAWKWGLQAQLPYNHPYAASFPGYGSQAIPTDADALTYLAAVATADGGTGVEVGVANAVDDFVKGCKADGIWSAIKASCILSGARTLSGALVPLAGSAPTNNNFVSADYNRKTGLAGNGTTKYIDTGRAGNIEDQDDMHAAVYVSSWSTAQADYRAFIGSGDSQNGASNVFWRTSPAESGARCRNATPHTSPDAISGNLLAGILGINRSASGSYVLRANATNLTLTRASQSPLSYNWWVFAANNNGSAANPTSSRLAFYSVGSSLNLALLDTRVSALYAAIGAAIP